MLDDGLRQAGRVEGLHGGASPLAKRVPTSDLPEIRTIVRQVSANDHRLLPRRPCQTVTWPCRRDSSARASGKLSAISLAMSPRSAPLASAQIPPALP